MIRDDSILKEDEDMDLTEIYDAELLKQNDELCEYIEKGNEKLIDNTIAEYKLIVAELKSKIREMERDINSVKYDVYDGETYVGQYSIKGISKLTNTKAKDCYRNISLMRPIKKRWLCVRSKNDHRWMK